MRRQHREGQLPDDATLGVGEAVELVHDDRGDLAEVEGGGVQQAIEQDFGDDDENARVGIDAAIAGDQADVLGESPSGPPILAFRGTSARSAR